MNTTLSIKNVEKISKALGDPYRLKIMEAVKKQDWMPCCEILGMIDLAQSTVSHHIKQLVDADLLVSEKDGRNMRYTVNKEVVTEYVNFLNPFKD
ncbi:transcriptional regulator [Flavipsychrobacter stenotrophus]|uniref:Transcriptional regulator n=1 Tax=Flavipsychrobacter stenotrophus TaxID=2077091 RepID=A0A2S7T0S7_9BACT|nr:metalloregulator ArsR/SmtB family transcription factor [Flavipsychrobacter stenotrophus]PQJ12467.1 transcriptional regulator [Flavipsychrobacter stenotrophus]